MIFGQWVQMVEMVRQMIFGIKMKSNDPPLRTHDFQFLRRVFRLYHDGTGFTLIEVLIALTIVSISVVSIYAAFMGISDTLARVDNYNRSVLLGMEKLWELEEALLQSDEARVSDFSGELKESDTRFFKWEFTGTDLESYPNLKEISLNLQWQQGRRSGNFSVVTYLRVKPKPQ